MDGYQYGQATKQSKKVDRSGVRHERVVPPQEYHADVEVVTHDQSAQHLAQPIIQPVIHGQIEQSVSQVEIHRDNICSKIYSNFSCLWSWWYNTKLRYWILSISAFITVLFIATMLPSSYYGVEYNQYALHRDKLFNKVDYDKVYDNGNYYLGLNHEMIKFPRTFTYEEFSGNDLKVFSKEGLEFGFQCTFQWRPIKEAIPEIHRQFRITYEPQVKNRVIATIKNTVTQFTTDDFIQERELIDRTITENIGNAVRELGFDIPRDKFQFAKPLLPDNVRSRFLQTEVQLVRNSEQALRQQQSLVIQETGVIVGNINSNATRVVTQANSISARIIAEATAQAFNIINTAEQNGLYLLFTGLNITDDYTKALLRKVIAIESNPDAKLYFGGQPKMVLGV